MILKRGDNQPVSKNFRAGEFFSDSFNAPEQHYIDERLFEAAQAIRDFVGAPVVVNNTYRTKEHNLAVSGASSSLHLVGLAADVQPSRGNKEFSAQIDRIAADIVKQGPLFRELRDIGITGFGVYDTFLHIDTRQGTLKHKDSLGTFAFWNQKKKA